MQAPSRPLRPALTAIGVLAALGSGCAKVAAPATPPKIVTVQCALAQKGADITAVFIIVPHGSDVVMANEPRAPRGALEVTKFEYQMAFPETPGWSASRLVLNRYDGKLEWELGDPPYSEDNGFTVRKGNSFNIWKCSEMKRAPLF